MSELKLIEKGHAAAGPRERTREIVVFPTSVVAWMPEQPLAADGRSPLSAEGGTLDGAD